jgi:phosphate transport system protein
MGTVDSDGAGATAGQPLPVPRSGADSPSFTLQKDISAAKRRLVGEASTAIGMLEAAIDVLFRLDEQGAREIMARDDDVDREEVAIEEECFRVLALFAPVARDFRTVVCLLRVNSDLERLADHATSLCKQTIKLKALGWDRAWPHSLVELGRRVPMQSQALLRAFISEDADAARQVLVRDQAIDSAEKRLFDESVDAMGDSRQERAAGLLLYRCGREMERAGDLLTNIAEDVIYLTTGSIVRHAEKRRLRQQQIQ